MICDTLELPCYEELSIRKVQKLNSELFLTLNKPVNESVEFFANKSYGKYVTSRINFKMDYELEQEFPKYVGSDAYKWCNFYDSYFCFFRIYSFSWVDSHKSLKEQVIFAYFLSSYQTLHLSH